MNVRSTSTLFLACLLGLVLASCNDDDCPSCPSTVPNADLENIWPNADSTSWMYAYREAVGPEEPAFLIYPTAEEVPPTPELSDLGDLLLHPEWPDSFDQFEAYVRLRFEGRDTTESGAIGQLLSERFFVEEELPKQGPAFEDELLARLWIARPDLRAKLRARMKTPPPNESAERTFGPIFLRGCTWVRTEELIGSYGALNLNISWEFLDEDLAPGSRFALQLLPDIAPDVILRGLILSNGQDVMTGAGSFRKAVRCAYLLDYGVALATTPEGEELGYFGSYDMGLVVYAPLVGPVRCYERRFVSNGDEDVRGLGDVLLDLVGSNAPGASEQ